MQSFPRSKLASTASGDRRLETVGSGLGKSLREFDPFSQPFKKTRLAGPRDKMIRIYSDTCMPSTNSHDTSRHVFRSKGRTMVAIPQPPVMLCINCKIIRNTLKSFGQSNSESRRPFSTARPLTEASNVYQDNMLLSRDVEQVRNSIPERLSQANTDEGDAQTRNITIRDLFYNPTCPSCSFILNTLKRFGVHSKVTELCLREDSQTGCLAATFEGFVLYLSGTGIENSYVQPLHSSQSINLAFVRDCLRDCAVNHVSDCVNSKTIPHTTGTSSIYLIDLYTDSLVRKSTRETYTALSYVWGNSNPNHKYDEWECSEDTLPRMQEAGFFSPDPSKYPQTILDAMRFTLLMGVRYVWIDRYCIPQDDLSEKHAQLRAMGSIYYHATFTIVAAEGDVTYGLRGLNTCLEGWKLRSRPTFCKSIPATVGIVYRPVTENTRWSTRGWTFQEQVFTRRCFIFRGETIIFKCQKCTWQEGTVKPILHDAGSYSSATTKLTIHRWPNMLYFKGLLEEFCKRELTYPCDSLEAFGGVLAALDASFPGGFLHGLPEICFDIALLWQGRGILKDRIALAKAEDKPIRDIPSWSWARWMGPLDLTAWDAAGECLFLSHYHQNFCSIKKIVDWKKESRSSGLLAGVNNCYEVYRPLARDLSLPIPSGWKSRPLQRSIDRESTLSSPLRTANRKFTHEALGEHAWFRFPIPLPTNNEVPGYNQFWSPNIRGRVKRTHLIIVPNEKAQQGEDDWYVLMGRPTFSQEDIQVGVVRIHDLDFMYGSSETRSGEFIAISVGHFILVPGQNVGIPWTFLAEWELKTRTCNGNIYEFYNVMLIEGRNGTVERRGLGRVEKSLWEGMQLEVVEVILA